MPQPTLFSASPFRALVRILPITAVLCLSGSIHSAAGGLENPRSPLRIKKAEYEFGRVMAGKQVRYSFVYTNVTGHRIEIGEVKPSCGCMSTGDWEGTLESGKSARITVLLETGTLQGPIRKALKMVVKADEPKAYQFWMKGTVWRPVSVIPSYAAFGKLSEEGQVRTRVLKLVSQMKTPLRIKKVVSDHPAFKPELVSIRKEMEYRLMVQATTPKKIGVHKGKITLDIDHPVFRSLEVRVSAYVPPILQITPKVLRLPKGPLSMNTRLFIHIEKHRPGKLVVSEFERGGVEGAELHELVVGRRYRVECLLPKGYSAPGKVPRSMRFKTNLKAWPEVEIPVQLPGVKEGLTPGLAEKAGK